MTSKDQIFQKIDNKIIEKLEQGDIPWQAPFDVNADPINAQTGSHYSGTDAWLLRLICNSDPYFMGFRQAQSLGGHIKRGNRGSRLCFRLLSILRKKPARNSRENRRASLQMKTLKPMFITAFHTCGISTSAEALTGTGCRRSLNMEIWILSPSPDARRY